jgi:hypothetical protein
MRFGGQRLTLLLLAALFCVQPASAQAPDDAFRAALAELREATYADKAQIVDRLSESGHTSARQVLAALLEDRLYVRSSDQVCSSSSQRRCTDDPTTGGSSHLKDVGSASRDMLTKIARTTASEGAEDGRRALRPPSADSSVRLDAVKR